MLQDFTKHLLEYSSCILPAFVFAILISAVLAELIPDSFVEKILNKDGFLYIFLASVIGALIPLCSCGMIPLANKLQKKGASWLITLSFLTSGNASSITTLILTLVLGFKITFIRFFVSIILGITTAYLFVYITKSKVSTQNMSSENKQNNCDDHKLFTRVKKEFTGLLIGFGPWVFTAIFIASVISVALKPEQVIKLAGVENFFSPFIFALIGFPFYFCGGSDIPVAKALIEKGASLGSITSFMVASPGINFTSFLVYQKWLGRNRAIIYLLISAAVCGAIGLGINFLILPLTPYEMR